jgi:hypothetical protein
VSVPAEFVGAWRRAGLTVDGRRDRDRCEVLWLQGPDFYADIRVPKAPEREGPPSGAAAVFDAAWAFAGIADWVPPVMTWHHYIDLRHTDLRIDAAPDSNPLSTEDGIVVERGSIEWNGRAVSFAEEWLRMTGDTPSWSVEVGPNRIQVTVEQWRICVEDVRPGGPFVATRFDFDHAGWHPTATVRDEPTTGRAAETAPIAPRKEPA